MMTCHVAVVAFLCADGGDPDAQAMDNGMTRAIGEEEGRPQHGRGGRYLANTRQ